MRAADLKEPIPLQAHSRDMATTMHALTASRQEIGPHSKSGGIEHEERNAHLGHASETALINCYDYSRAQTRDILSLRELPGPLRLDLGMGPG